MKRSKIVEILFPCALTLAMLLPGVSASAQANAPQAAGRDGAVHTYRLLYTLTEEDGGKRIGVQHFAFTAMPNKMSTFSQESRTPYTIGPQTSYVSIGLSCSAAVAIVPEGIEVSSQVKLTNVAKAEGAITSEPVIRETKLDDDSVLKVGKPVIIGTLDTPGGTRSVQVELLVEEIS